MRDSQPIVATLDASALARSGLARLADAVHAGARFVLVVFENNANTELTANVRACGVRSLEEIGPCDQNKLRAALARAGAFVQSEAGGIAAIIVNGPCAWQSNNSPEQTHECDQCYAGFAVESNPLTISELAQMVALEEELGRQT